MKKSSSLVNLYEVSIWNCKKFVKKESRPIYILMDLSLIILVPGSVHQLHHFFSSLKQKNRLSTLDIYAGFYDPTCFY